VSYVSRAKNKCGPTIKYELEPLLFSSTGSFSREGAQLILQLPSRKRSKFHYPRGGNNMVDSGALITLVLID
jgi:hypothetical protein